MFRRAQKNYLVYVLRELSMKMEGWGNSLILGRIGASFNSFYILIGTMRDDFICLRCFFSEEQMATYFSSILLSLFLRSFYFFIEIFMNSILSSVSPLTDLKTLLA